MTPATEHSVLRCALGGLVATGAMSVPMLLAGRFGWMNEQPPERITDAALDAADIEVEVEPAHHALAAVLHAGFGVGCGALFGLVHDRLRPPGPVVVHGIGFGLIVWATSYLGWIPMLGLLPPATRDRPGRARTMLGAHVVYGAVLGLAAGRG